MIRLIPDTLALLTLVALLGCSGPSEVDPGSSTWADMVVTAELEEAAEEVRLMELLALEPPPQPLFQPALEIEKAIDRLTVQIGRMSDDLVDHQAALSLAESFPQELEAVELTVPESISRGIVIMGAAAAFVGAGILIMLAVLLSRVRKIPTWQVQQVNAP